MEYRIEHTEGRNREYTAYREVNRGYRKRTQHRD